MASTYEAGEKVGKQKVRESCNACSSQKIRCGKERPACGRCVDKSLACEYSLSKRTGQRRTSGTGSPDTLMSAGPANGHLGSTLADDLDMFNFDAVGPRDPSLPFDDNAWMLNSPPTASELTSMQYFDASLFEELGSEVPASASASNSGTASRLGEDFGLGLPSNSRQTPNHPTPQQTQTMATANGHGSPNIDAHHPGHGCIAIALQIFGHLHVQTEACVTAADPIFGVQRPNIVVRGLETVLTQNREALKKLKQILLCPCSNEQEVLIAVFLVAQKTVWWYATAISSDRPPFSHELNRWMPLISTDVIFMGGYCLDLQAQMLVRVHVILGELREHMQPLLVELQRRACSSADGSPSDQSPGSIASGISCESRSNIIESHQRALRESLRALIAKANIIRES